MAERICTIPAEMIANFQPDAVTDKLKEAGFEFIRDVCPVKIAGQWSASRNEDGSVTYTQQLPN